MSALTSPGPLPRPITFDRRWGSELVSALQRYFDNLRGDVEAQGKLITHSGRVCHLTNVTDAAYTAKLTDEIVSVDRAGTVTVTLPEAPANGTRLSIADGGGNAGTYAITIQRAGSTDTIGGATSVTITSPYRWVEFVYDAAGAVWLSR